MVPPKLNNQGECEAVALLNDRNLAACIASIRANAWQVVVAGRGGVSVSISQHVIFSTTNQSI